MVTCSPSQPTGQWFDAADGQRWWFDSGSIAFDFAYTGGFGGPPEWERWHGPADVARWWRERFGVEVPVDDRAYRRARKLREAIAGAVVAAAHDQPIPAGDAATIDRYAAMPDLAAPARHTAPPHFRQDARRDRARRGGLARPPRPHPDLLGRRLRRHVPGHLALRNTHMVLDEPVWQPAQGSSTPRKTRGYQKGELR